MLERGVKRGRSPFFRGRGGVPRSTTFRGGWVGSTASANLERQRAVL